MSVDKGDILLFGAIKTGTSLGMDAFFLGAKVFKWIVFANEYLDVFQRIGVQRFTSGSAEWDVGCE